MLASVRATAFDEESTEIMTGAENVPSGIRDTHLVTLFKILRQRGYGS